jgi:hypothetical protein
MTPPTHNAHRAAPGEGAGGAAPACLYQPVVQPHHKDGGQKQKLQQATWLAASMTMVGKAMILRGLRLCSLLVVLLASSMVAGRRRGSAAAFVLPQVSTACGWSGELIKILGAGLDTALLTRSCTLHKHTGYAIATFEWRHLEHWKEKTSFGTARKQQQQQY